MKIITDGEMFAIQKSELTELNAKKIFYWWSPNGWVTEPIECCWVDKATADVWMRRLGAKE